MTTVCKNVFFSSVKENNEDLIHQIGISTNTGLIKRTRENRFTLNIFFFVNAIREIERSAIS